MIKNDRLKQSSCNDPLLPKFLLMTFFLMPPSSQENKTGDQGGSSLLAKARGIAQVDDLLVNEQRGRQVTDSEYRG